MTTQELLGYYERYLSILDKLKEDQQKLATVENKIAMLKDQIIKKIYISGLSDGTINSQINALREQSINTIVGFASNFDLMRTHSLQIKTYYEILDAFKEGGDILDEDKTEITELSKEFEKVIDIIYEYIKTRSLPDLIKVIDEISVMTNGYNKIISRYTEIKEFVKKAETQFDENESEKIISLHFYDEYTTVEDFAKNLELLNRSYEEVCQLFGETIAQNQLKVIKIESGSLFGKFIGSNKIIDAFSFLIKKITDLIFSKFTFEGQILRHKQLIELLQEDTEFIDKYKQLGLDTDFSKEEVMKSHVLITKSIQSLITKNTKVKINDEEFSIKAEMQQKFLKESKTPLLDESSEKLEGAAVKDK